MTVLFVSANSHLRSTTSPLHAMFEQLAPEHIRPVVIFREDGPWVRELIARGIQCFITPFDAPDKLSPIATAKRVWAMVRIARRERAQVIHCNEHDSYPLVRLVARITGLPVVVSIHFHFEERYGHWLFRPPYEPEVLQFVSTAVLEASRPGLPHSGGTQALVVPNALAIDDYLRRSDGWELIRTRLGVQDGSFLVGTASAVHPHKRLRDFVLLIASLRRRGLPAVGVICGGHPFSDPHYEASLRQVIDAHGLHDTCKMVGNVDPLAPWVRAFDLFVSTSEIEPFGMSACEAMACGTPAIGYNAGGIANVLHDPWCVVPVGDLELLADRAEALYGNRALLQDVGRDAAAHVRALFDGPSVAPRQLQIYRSVGLSKRSESRRTPAETSELNRVKFSTPGPRSANSRPGHQ